MSKVSTVKGFADLFVPDSTVFTRMESEARRVFSAYGYQELRIPILEYTELFARSIGAETDVVQKEMFTFPDRKGRSLTLRPEATAGMMRAYIDNACHSRDPVTRLFSFGPMFRYERPQKGRMRQFHQLDCECLGAHEPQADAEVVLMLMHFLQALGLTDLALEINTLGCKACRPAYNQALLAFLQTLDTETLCEDCRRRLGSNPLRVLDCKVPACKSQTANAPHIRTHVCADCETHFAQVLALLNKEGIPYVETPRLVRGLDYYVRTTFEVVSNAIGAQGSVAGGGRYDGLIAGLGGPEVPGIGFACGMERLALLLGQEKATSPPRQDFYIAALDPTAPDQALCLAQILRKAGLCGECSFASKSIKSQMRYATRVQTRYCLLLGETELSAATVLIKNMDTGEQENISYADLSQWATAVQNTINSLPADSSVGKIR